jgi:hypothetical protein
MANDIERALDALYYLDPGMPLESWFKVGASTKMATIFNKNFQTRILFTNKASIWKL